MPSLLALLGPKIGGGALVKEVVLHKDYEVLAQIGRGSQGTTFKAKHVPSGALVAIKVMDVGAVSNWKDVELFERESKALESLNHPAIPDYIDSWTVEEGGPLQMCLAQEFVEGLNLRDELAKGGRWSDEQALDALEQLLQILIYLHDRVPPVIHRDVKPNNIIRRPDGQIVLVDFGAVQTQRAGTVGGSTVIGTPGYMPMEQVIGQAGPRSDLYALGATVGHMLTGVEPSKIPLRNNRFDFRSQMDAPVADASRALPIIERLTQPSQEDRFQSAREALKALQAPQYTLPVSVDGPGAGSPVAAPPDLRSHPVRHASEFEAWFNPVRSWVQQAKISGEIEGQYTIIDRPLPVELNPQQRELMALGFKFIGRQTAIKRGSEKTRTVWSSPDGMIYAVETEGEEDVKLVVIFDDDKKLKQISASAEGMGDFEIRDAGELSWNLLRFQKRVHQERTRKPVVGLDMDRFMLIHDPLWFKPAYFLGGSGFVERHPVRFSQPPRVPGFAGVSLFIASMLLLLFPMTVAILLLVFPIIWFQERESRQKAKIRYADNTKAIAKERRDGTAPARTALPPLTSPAVDHVMWTLPPADAVVPQFVPETASVDAR